MLNSHGKPYSRSLFFHVLNSFTLYSSLLTTNRELEDRNIVIENLRRIIGQQETNITAERETAIQLRLEIDKMRKESDEYLESNLSLRKQIEEHSSIHLETENHLRSE